MQSYLILAFSFLVLVLPWRYCADTIAGTEATRGDDAAALDREVWQAALRWVDSTATGPLGLVVETSGIDLSSEWNSTDDFRFLGQNRIERVIPKGLMQNFLQRNHGSTSITGLRREKSFHWFHQVELEHLFSEGSGVGWEKLREDLGVFEIVTLSLPGYGSDHQSALLYLFRSRGALAGDGYFLYLNIDHKEWCVEWIDIVVSS